MATEYVRTTAAQNESAAVPAQMPFVSVIMPVRNEEKAIRQSVGAVMRQDYPRELMEIIVVDGMSTDKTRELLAELKAQDERIRVLDNPGRIMAKGFNIGFKQARGEVIVMMGGHAEMCPEYVSTCCRLLSQRLAECVGGTLETVSQTPEAEAISAALTSRFGVGSVAFRLGTNEHRYVDTVAFGAYRREAINGAGVLDEEFVRNQDDEFNHRLRKLGARILLAPEIHCRYYSRSSLSGLWRQYFNYGLWKVRVLQKHPRQMQVRHFVPALFVSALGFFLLTSSLSRFTKFAFVGLCGLYLAANLAASVQVALKNRRRWWLLPSLPVIFAVLHFSYGCGFLLGLVRFRHYWKTPDSKVEPAH